ncbi:MAG: hypothetical protein M0Z80_09160 [Treponema sp.]|nr:hypothetical protein [Treponema sp.]
MPRLQDIERFKKDLAALSREAETLARWGETAADLRPPEGSGEPPPARPEASPGPQRAAAPRPAAPRPTASRRPEPPPEEEALPPDFATLLENLPLGEEAEAPGAAEEGTEDFGELLEELEEPPGAGELEEPPSEGATSAEEGGFDLGDFAAAMEEEPAAEEESPPLRPQGAEADARPEETRPGAGPADDEFDLDEFTIPEEAEPLEAFPPAAGEAPESGEIADFEAPIPETKPPEAPLRSEEAGAGLEDFEIPDLGDFDFGTEAVGGAESSRGVEPAEEEFAIPEMGAEPAGALPQGPSVEETPSAPAAGGGRAEEGFSFGEAPEAGFGAKGSGDSFDNFSFGETAEPGLGADLDQEIASLGAEAPLGETFALDQEWSGFGDEAAPPRQKPPRPSPPRPTPQAPEEKTKPVALGEEQVDRLQDALLSYPLNLRVAIEDILANGKGSEAQQSKLVWAMVDDASAEDAALIAGRILKHRIPIPRGYEKKTGAAVEAEKRSFRYALIHTVLPALRTGFLAALGIFVLGWLGWQFVYTPLAADALYRSGYHRIAENRFPEAEEDFARATSMREFKVWYYRYAEAYAAKRQYILAEKKYASLVARYPHERQAILDWARLEQEQMKYREAVQVLVGVSQPLYREAPTEEQLGKTGLLSWDYFNQAGLLLLGDIYLDWADEDVAKFEDARRAYATLIDHYGYKDLYLERMLLYFIRSDGSQGPGGAPRDNLADILALKKHFLGERGDPLSALARAELGGYLMDHDLLDDVRVMLMSAAKKDPALPEAHYELVRYFRRADMPGEEKIALDNAVKTFAALRSLTPRRSAMYIQSLIWRGNFRVDKREWIGAEQDFTEAAAQYEQALELRRVKKQARFGEAYAGLAEVAFWQRDDLDSALAYLERAADSGWDTPKARYRRGYILYRKGRFADSLVQFYRAGQGGNESPYLDFAFGDALFQRGDYLSADGYFRRVAAAMKTLYAQIYLPQPGQRASQAEILELLMKADNNLGASLLRSAALVGDPKRRAEGATDITASARIHDELVGSGVWLAEPQDLASQNLAQAIWGRTESAPLIYTQIEPSMDFPRTGLALQAFEQSVKAAQAPASQATQAPQAPAAQATQAPAAQGG